MPQPISFCKLYTKSRSMRRSAPPRPSPAHADRRAAQPPDPAPLHFSRAPVFPPPSIWTFLYDEGARSAPADAWVPAFLGLPPEPAGVAPAAADAPARP
jgi:hypothetical protein